MTKLHFSSSDLTKWVLKR